MKYLILLPGVIHVYIFFLESFLWDTPRGRKAFHMTEADAKTTKPVAFNQGFYNLFLAIGVIAGFVLWMGFIPVAGGIVAGLAVMVFSLGAILAAGLVLIASSPTLWPAALLQIVPAVLGLGLALGSFA
jgi:putative membrane protein